MTQDSNRNAFSPWGEPNRLAPASGWAPFVTTPVLLGHIVVMLSVMALLTLVNLMVNPGTWWSLAILVLWLTIVIVHVLARFSLGFLLDEEPDTADRAPRVTAEPHGGAVHGPAVPNGRHTTSREDVPISWELKSDDDAPPTWRTPDEPTTSAAPAQEEPERSNGTNERVPWRAATDIAWLRRHRSYGEGGTSAGAHEDSPS